MQILLNAISSDVLEIPLGHISPDALADGELWPLHNLAEIFAELCDILLKRDDTPAQPQSVEVCVDLQATPSLLVFPVHAVRQ